MAEPVEWFVYIIHCSDDSLYTGITTDITRRFDEHLNQRNVKKAVKAGVKGAISKGMQKGTQKGAKYFRGRKPLKIVYQESGHTRSSASRQEIHIKRLSRKAKLALTQLSQTSI